MSEKNAKVLLASVILARSSSYVLSGSIKIVQSKDAMQT